MDKEALRWSHSVTHPQHPSIQGHSQVVPLEGGVVQDIEAPLVAQRHIKVRTVTQQLQDLHTLLPYCVMQGCVPI